MKGRVFGAPVFEAVTEGRQKRKSYSACGDLCLYVLKELGLRDERILNRNDDGGIRPRKIGKNLELDEHITPGSVATSRLGNQTVLRTNPGRATPKD